MTPTTKRVGLESSLKRIAWGYGCAKKGSDEEVWLCDLLLKKAKALLDHPSDVPGYVKQRLRSLGEKQT